MVEVRGADNWIFPVGYPATQRALRSGLPVVIAEYNILHQGFVVSDTMFHYGTQDKHQIPFPSRLLCGLILSSVQWVQ